MSDAPIDQLRFSFLRRLLACASVLVASLLLVIHFCQFDILAAVTLIPPWMWLVPAAIGLAISYKAITRRVFLTTICLWALFAFCFAEESRSLLRSGGAIEKVSEHSIRIATINCNFGNVNAAKEALEFKPDIVLIQESMGEQPLAKIADEYFEEQGSSLHGGDVSIIANGTIKTVHMDPASHFVHAVVTVGSTKIDVVCLRLSAPVFRIDFLSSGFWTDHAKTRRNHRRQLQEIADHLEQFAESEHAVIGGDFNLVGNDGALSALHPYEDSFFTAGSGWGNTGTSDYPLFRVDQIWTSSSLKCRASQAFETENSDHRMVIADFTPPTLLLTSELTR